MNENKEKYNTVGDQHSTVLSSHLENRHGEGRRSIPSDGFTYISTVGMIDRRERIRRKDDPFDFS